MPVTPIHHYRACLSWTGSTGAGYDAYDRAHQATAPPAKSTLALSSDPAYRGDPTLWNPEQLLVLAASSCQMLSFLALAAKSRIDVVSYSDDAEGEMHEHDQPLRVTRIVLRPRIVLAADSAIEPAGARARLQRLIDLAHRECFIANSLRTAIVIEATVEWTQKSARLTP